MLNKKLPWATAKNATGKSERDKHSRLPILTIVFDGPKPNKPADQTENKTQKKEAH